MKKKALLPLFVLAASACCSSNGVTPAIQPDKEVEAKVESILKKMTLEEKIGQMTQLQIDMITGYGTEMNMAVLDTMIGIYKVGSILNCPESRSQTPETFRRIITELQKKSMETMGIPCLYGLDENHGASYITGATYFPQEINLGASFNPALATVQGEITAYETRASFVQWTFNPTMDLARNPAWSRIWESFGEDPLLQGEMGKALLTGYQGTDPNHLDNRHIASCIKHYMCYGNPATGKDRTPAYVSRSDMREKYFAPFKACIRVGALSLMPNSSSVNGVPCHASHELLTEWIKEDLNWDGMIITDWADINNLYTREKVAVDEKDAIRISINAGVDMSMVPYNYSYCEKLKELVEEGAVKMSRIDDAVRRVLRLKIRLGLFEETFPDFAQFDKFACAEFAQKALESALETEVLLKNDNNVLPIAKGKKILLTGPAANSMRSLNGGWTNTWQGENAVAEKEQYNTIYEAFCNKFGKENVNFVQGVEYDEEGDWQNDRNVNIAAAAAAARSCDVIVACIGENSYCETKGNINDLNLSANQKELVKALSQSGKPVILVLNEGRPRTISDIEPLADGIIDIFLPGNYGADALAMLMSGETDFSARMPYTYPKYVNSPATYDYKVSEKTGTMAGAYDYNAIMDVQWTFGDGISYNNYEMTNLKLDKTSFSSNDKLTFTVEVKNCGNMTGKVPVLLFSSDLVASIIPDSRRLRAFTKISLEPGQSQTVSLCIKASDLAFVGFDEKWHLEKGDFKFVVGNQSISGCCTEDKIWETPNIL